MTGYLRGAEFVPAGRTIPSTVNRSGNYLIVGEQINRIWD